MRWETAVREWNPCVHPNLDRRRALTWAFGALLGAAVGMAARAARAADADFWTLARTGGNALLLRPAITEPGIGDPPDFRLDRCSTQRNLSQQGREQAARLAARVGAEGVRLNRIRSSACCRCRDTARAELRRLRAAQNWLWVTHQVNITALTGSGVAMGEVLLVRPDAQGRPQVLARWQG